MLEIVVDNRIRMRADDVPPVAASALKSACEHSNPDFAKVRALGYSTRGVPDKIKTWLVKDGELSLPRGAMRRLRSVLADHKIPYRVIDRRTEGAIVSWPLRYQGFELRQHQRDMVRIGQERNQCILRGATGSGKTCAAFALAAEIGLNTLVILPNKGLFEQWAKWAGKVLGIEGDALGIIQGKRKRLRPLTIAMQPTLGKGVPEDVREFFGAVIVDETQRAAANTLYSAVDSMPAKYRIGVSASEKRKDRKECLIYDLFSDVAYEAGRDAMTAAGHILDVEIRVIPTQHRADWYAQKVDFNKLLDGMTEDKARNALAFEHIARELKSGEQVIVLTHRREHARDIERHFFKQRIGSGMLLGDQEPGDAEEFQRSVKGIENGDVRIGVGTYGALGYGIDLPAVSVGVAMTPIATNPGNFNQVRGRLCRPNPKAGKTHGRMYVLVDFKVFGMKPLRNIVAWNSTVKVLEKGEWVDGREYLAGKVRHERRFSATAHR